jgi:hypothetical protein
MFVIEPGTGWLREIVSDVDACDLLYENATAHPVQDLFCAFDGSPALARALSADGERRRTIDLEREVETLTKRLTAAQQELEAAQAEVERLRASTSMRLTAPLRRARRWARSWGL